MKKTLLATMLAVLAVSASAVEVGVIGGVTYHSGIHDSNQAGVTIGEKFGPFGATVEADHNYTMKTATNADRYSLIGSYDVVKLGPAQVAVKAGVDYLSQRSDSALSPGYGLMAGVGASVPVAGKVSATVDYRYDAGQSRVKALNGSQVLFGVKYAF